MNNRLENFILSFENVSEEDAPFIYVLITTVLAGKFPEVSAKLVDTSLSTRITASMLLVEAKKDSQQSEFNVIERILSGDFGRLSDDEGLLPEVLLIILGSQTKRDYSTALNVLAKKRLGHELGLFRVTPEVIATMRRAIIRLMSM